MTSNNLTIDTYNASIQKYIDSTPVEVFGVVKDYINKALEELPKYADILEIGSGLGYEADYIDSLGYSVVRTDAASGFVDFMKSRGSEASILNAITDDLPSDLDLVIANAVLLHFSREDSERVIHKIYRVLKPGGRFAFAIKQGCGEEWSDEKLGSPRYFYYWEEGQIYELLRSVGFAGVDISTDQLPNATWLNIVADKF